MNNEIYPYTFMLTVCCCKSLIIIYASIRSHNQAKDSDDARSWIDTIKKNCNPDEDVSSMF